MIQDLIQETKVELISTTSPHCSRPTWCLCEGRMLQQLPDVAGLDSPPRPAGLGSTSSQWPQGGGGRREVKQPGSQSSLFGFLGFVQRLLLILFSQPGDRGDRR